MYHFSTSFYFFSLLSALSVCSTAGLTVEEQLQQLRENNDKIMSFLAVKDARLKELELNVEELEGKVARLAVLELKISRLEEKNQQHEFQKKIDSNSKVRGTSTEKIVSFPRTCRELRAADPSLSSGMHWIDPDGQSVGDDPIYVYCDMTKGHCADPGCYSRPVRYNATMKQMTALAVLSSECHQSIQYDCNFAPFEIGGVAFGWWNDRNGTAQYFWSGSNASVHTCQCGIDDNCVDSLMTCNCDSAAPVPLTDKGVISDKNYLPITRLNFGRTQLASSSGVHTLGRLECSGQVAVDGMPKSCADLWRIGHTLNGMYSIMGTKQVESVYCDFTKLPSDSGFQTWIGYNDVKTFPVYFNVQKNKVFNTTNTPIPFEVEILNIGNAMNLTSGIFTAPRAGIYSFFFNGMAGFPGSSSRLVNVIDITLNGNRIGRSQVDEVGTVFQYDTISLPSTLNLKTGDEISLQIFNTSLSTGSYLHGGLENQFSGWLQEENM